eukprot:TRINITY_DN462_c0_g1_i1.p1 TRINITY_DN462_c0_g1~~TRINITY_DN462_c0_g1_i1.p1  ORF type:complete len:338 (-),score=57.96 TRINITY_DN462_c0_g1_i1:405-1370(-)
MAAATRARRGGSSRNGEQAKIVGGLCLLGLVAGAAMCGFDASAFVSMRAAPLMTTSHASVAPKVAAPPTYAGVQTTVSSQAVAACALLVAAAAARSALASQRSRSRSSSSRAVVRCANATVASPVAMMPEQPVVLQPTSSPLLLDLSEPVAIHVPAPVHFAASPTIYNIACQAPVQVAAPAAARAEQSQVAADATTDAASAFATRSAFAGARAARVIGGVRYSASRSHSQNRSGKSIRCYVAQKFSEVVPLPLVYDPSRLPAKMQAGLQVASRVGKVFSRNGRKNSPACSSAGSFTGVNIESMYFGAKRLYNNRSFENWLA